LPKDESSELTEKIIDPKSIIVKEIENEHETHTTGGAAQGAADPGVTANAGSNKGMSLTPGAEGGSIMEKEKSKSTVIAPEKLRITRSPSGRMTPTSVSVAMPKSYFIKAYMTEKHTDKEPGEVVLADYIKNELDKYRSSLKACLDLKTDEAVSIATFTDLMPIAAESPSQTASGVSLLMGNHGKEIVLGALALVSLFMVSTMVRKSGAVLATPTDGISTTAGATVDALLAKAGGGAKSVMKVVTEEDAAEVGESGQTLDGVELDEETVRAQQVVEQVSTLVKENPDTAANLIKRWMNRV
jgi:flagellar biosynthesis/type III secretory pathway M-ring protein FliF/YscJ